MCRDGRSFSCKDGAFTTGEATPVVYRRCTTGTLLKWALLSLIEKKKTQAMRTTCAACHLASVGISEM